VADTVRDGRRASDVVEPPRTGLDLDGDARRRSANMLPHGTSGGRCGRCRCGSSSELLHVEAPTSSS
jgi:hypothetical protein